MDGIKLINLIRDVDYTPRKYSGRGMFGANCVGVTVERNGEATLIADVVTLLVDEEDWETLRDFCTILRRTQTDGMGLGTIVYWRTVAWPEDMEDGKFTDDLKHALANFDRKNALGLSDRIHAAEADGYDVTNGEDLLWSQLTDRLESDEE